MRAYIQHHPGATLAEAFTAVLGRPWIAEQLELKADLFHPWRRPIGGKPPHGLGRRPPKDSPPWARQRYHPEWPLWADRDDAAAPELTPWEWWLVTAHRRIPGDGARSPREMAQVLDDEGITEPAVRDEARAAWGILDAEEAAWKNEMFDAAAAKRRAE